MFAFLTKRRRELERIVLERIVLEALIDGPSYGYPIRNAIRARPDGRNLAFGLIYTILARLVRLGYAEVVAGSARWEGPPRKLYQLTAAGREVINACP